PSSLEVLTPSRIRLTFPGPSPDWAYFFYDFYVLPMHYWVPHADTVAAATAYAGLFDTRGNYTRPIPGPARFDHRPNAFGSRPSKASPSGPQEPATQPASIVRNPRTSTPPNGVNIVKIKVFPPAQAIAQVLNNPNLILPRSYNLTAAELSGVATHRFLAEL